MSEVYAFGLLAASLTFPAGMTRSSGQASLALDIGVTSAEGDQKRKGVFIDMIQELQAGIGSHGSMGVIAIVGVVALVLFFKVAHFLLRLLLGLIALAAIGGACWWFFIRQ